MISGVVVSACTGNGLGAQVGIAGRHVCSDRTKGSFFLSGLPVGTLKLAVAKTGYKLYDATIIVATGGTIADVAFQPDTPGGCADPPPADVVCSCGDGGCTPP